MEYICSKHESPSDQRLDFSFVIYLKKNFLIIYRKKLFQQNKLRRVFGTIRT